MSTARSASPALLAAPDLQARAWAHERRVLAAANPVAWVGLRLAGAVDRDVCRVPGLGYVVSGAEAVRTVLSDPDGFTKNGPGSSGEILSELMGPYALNNMEGQAHRDVRRRLHGLFTPAAADGICREALGDLVTGIITPLRRGQAVDLVRFARILTGAAMRHLTGLRADPQGETVAALRLYDDGTRLASYLSVRMRPLRPREAREGRAVVDRMVAPAEEAWHRGGDETVPGRLRELGLSLEEARGVIAMILVAGMETTVTALPRLVALVSDLRLWEIVAQRPESMAGVIEEGLRYIAPLPAVTRSVRRDCELAGRHLRAGRVTFLFIHAALRDPRVIARGEHFDPERPIPPALRHLWFGAGPHYCLGAPLALRELSLVLDRLAREVGPLEVVERSATARALLPSYRRLVVRRVPRSPGGQP